MARVVKPWQILLAALAGWINQQQQHVIEYLREENRVLREQLQGKRLRLTDNQRRRLAAKGKILGRRVIGIGGSLAAPPLPHHRAYGSVHGGSADYAA